MCLKLKKGQVQKNLSRPLDTGRPAFVFPPLEVKFDVCVGGGEYV